MPKQPKILTLDIETSPNVALTWGMFNQNVSLAQLRDSGQMISWAARWRGKKPVMFMSVYHDGQEAMVAGIHALLCEADIVIHYNGRSFDMKHLRRAFLEAGMNPTSPVAEVDLLLAVRKQFKFTSNKLDYVAQRLGLGGKTAHTGMALWVDCLFGTDAEKAKAWALMKRYNKQDVAITEALYDRLIPWLPAHPHMALFTGTDDCCRNCGSTNLQKHGYAYTNLTAYVQYQCKDCGKWSRGKHAIQTVTAR